MKTGNGQIGSTGDLSASYNSDAIDLKDATMFSLQAVLTGSPVGTIKLQVTNEPTPSNWKDVNGSSVSITAATNVVWDKSRAPYRWVRIAYTRSSGTGSINIYATMKSE
jgi:hypothetical protein